MPLLKRNNKDKPLIPPVESETKVQRSDPSSYPIYHNSNARTYVRSRDGDPYSSTTPRSDVYDSSDAYDAYGSYRKSAANDGEAGLDQNREQLFSGYKPGSIGSGRFFDGPASGREPPAGEETEEDIEGIKQQTRFVKQESVNSTRNALRLAREAEETAQATLVRLDDQSQKLADTERHLDVSKTHASTAQDRTDELKQLNRSIFRPVITFNKDAKRAAQAARIEARYEEERREREKALLDVRETQNRLGRAQTYGRGDDEESIAGGRLPKTNEQLASRKEQRKRFQFEATASDDEVEDELDDNLGEISAVTKRLKALGMAMGEELDAQNKRLDTIEQKTVGVDGAIFRNTERLKRIK